MVERIDCPCGSTDGLSFPPITLLDQENGEREMKRFSLVLAILGLLLTSMPVLAVNTTQPLTVNMAISARAKLTLGVNAINFADADPDSSPSILATENPVSVTAKVRTGAASTATLTHLAGGDLTSGGNTIAISNVTWTVTGAGFVSGTMNKTTAQSAGNWTGSGSYSGTYSYSIVNSWSYATGNYTASTTYTLTAP